MTTFPSTGIVAAPEEATGRGPRLENLNKGEQAYADWLRDRTPGNMSRILDAYAPTINGEIARYSGPRAAIRSRAKVLAVNAVKKYNPMSGASLNTWIVTNLKPLSRYAVKQRDVAVPEVAARQAAQVESARARLADEFGREPTDDELADEIGISPKRVAYVRGKAMASVSSGSFDESGSDEFSGTPGVVTPSPLPFATEAVYHDLSEGDRLIFDSATGSHGAPRIPAKEVAARLGVSPASVSQRAKAIADQIAYVAGEV